MGTRMWHLEISTRIWHLEINQNKNLAPRNEISRGIWHLEISTRIGWWPSSCPSVCLSVHSRVTPLSGRYLPATELYATKLGMMVHHHDRECHAKRLGSCLQGQGHSVGSDPQKLTDSSVSWFFIYISSDVLFYFIINMYICGIQIFLQWTKEWLGLNDLV